jgi:hypothetical protein
MAKPINKPGVSRSGEWVPQTRARTGAPRYTL